MENRDHFEQIKQAINMARNNPEEYFVRIQNLITEVIEEINRFNKLYILGGLGARLLEATPNLSNQLTEKFIDAKEKDGSTEELDDFASELLKKDDEIEVLVEYAFSLATSTKNSSSLIPTEDDIELIYHKLKLIKSSINFYQLSIEPADGITQSDNLLRTLAINNFVNLRGNGYHNHISEVYLEIFEPFNEYIYKIYKFNSSDLFQIILKLDDLVISKTGGVFGASKAHERFIKWVDKNPDDDLFRRMEDDGKNFWQFFVEDNPDLTLADNQFGLVCYSLNDISAYPKIFKVIPESNIEKEIFNLISHTFGDNNFFLQPPRFKGFIQNDTIVNLKPLIKENDAYYHFSNHLAFRNIFQITEALIKESSQVYFDTSYKGNSNFNSRDNYLERKTKQLFQKILPNSSIYHSLSYDIIENGLNKRPELDLLVQTADFIYIIEVKAGELATKHWRGALKGLKDRLSETLGEGSYQCHRAFNYIMNTDRPHFNYSDNGRINELLIDKSQIRGCYKITVTYEHFGALALNLQALIDSNIINVSYKDAWFISLFDLMVFADLIEGEEQLKDYLEQRSILSNRVDVVMIDEIDVLGLYLDSKLPLSDLDSDSVKFIINSNERIDEYYNNLIVGFPNVEKPRKI